MLGRLPEDDNGNKVNPQPLKTDNTGFHLGKKMTNKANVGSKGERSRGKQVSTDEWREVGS